MSTQKKRWEKFLIREFLEFMGFAVSRLTASERPDARATVTKDGTRSRIGIEVTLYQVDAAPGANGGSPGTQLDAFWREVQKSLRRRLVARRRALTLHVHVFLKKGQRALLSDARGLAAELVAFAQENAPRPKQSVCIATLPSRYPLLCQYMREVRITNTAPAVGFRWVCADTSVASVGVQLNYVTQHVARKGNKCRNYRWGNVDERWLLICAAGTPIVSCAGPCPESVDWQDEELITVCKASGFDRIYFYERPWQWCQPIWPYDPAIRKQ